MGYESVKYLGCDKVRSYCGTVELTQNSAFETFVFSADG
jgi:hypothetical protein